LRNPTKRSKTLVAPPRVLAELLSETGVCFNGTHSWDIQVYDAEVYRRILTKGNLGLGEAYMDELWDCQAIDEMFSRLLSHKINEKLGSWYKLRLFGEALHQYLFNLQSSRRAFQIGVHHYDTGNDIFEAMLDPTMCYSCGYWHQAEDLHQAQLNKLDMICRKLELSPGEHLLEIGCGWGGLARYAAEHYGVKVTGITVSNEQLQLARRLGRDLPITYKLMDYRELSGSFDKIVSVGMFEHVGTKNYPAFFERVKQVLNDHGLFLLHTIGLFDKSATTLDSWMNKYIFPNGNLPSAVKITAALEKRFLIEDWHNFGQDYDQTLMAWWRNFDAAWPELEPKYGKRFYRMWKYYLLSCAGFFRSRQGQVWQLVMSKQTRSAVYRSVR